MHARSTGTGLLNRAVVQLRSGALPPFPIVRTFAKQTRSPHTSSYQHQTLSTPLPADIKVTSRRAGAKKTDKGEEKLDALIADYRTKLLGGGGKSKAKQGKPGQSLKRWFE